MTFDYDHIETLVLKEFEGTIQEEERAYLHKAISEDLTARKLREDMLLFLNRQDIKDSIKRVPEAITAENILTTFKIRKARRKRVLRSRVIAGLAVLITVSAGLFIGRQWTSEKVNTVAQVPQAAGKHIELQLPDGQIIALSQDKERIQAGLVSLSNNNKKLSYQSGGSSGIATLTVPPGKDYTIQLGDGSEIQLNAATTLQFPFSFNDSTREITLHGEAYLKVAKNTHKPFIVHLPKGTVQVLGTEFNVNTYDTGSVKISLVDGAVKMKTQHESVILEPGDQLVYGSRDIRVNTFDADDVLAWRKGIYVFYDAALAEVCKVVTRWYGIEVVMDHEMAAGQRFTGAIDRNEPIDTFLVRLKSTNKVDYYRDGERIHLK